MKGKKLFTQILATIGTVLIWIPIVLPIFISISRLISGERFVFDFLLPAELFAVILSGAILLIWAVILAKSHRIAVLVSLGIAIASLVSSQIVAVTTGLASGEVEPIGLPWIIVTALIGIYNFSVIAMGIAGIFLVQKLRYQGVHQSEK